MPTMPPARPARPRTIASSSHGIGLNLGRILLIGVMVSGQGEHEVNWPGTRVSSHYVDRLGMTTTTLPGGAMP